MPSIDANEGSQVLAAARVQANAAQAALFGLGRVAGVQPPPLYAYDPDVGRLAVTTPAYNTAIVAVNRGAFPYGGVELARLFDREQDVAGGVGGRPPASFGVVVRDGAGRIAAASQRALESEGGEPLRLLEAPRGATSSPGAYPYAGPFERLRVQGTTRRGSVEIRTTHRFEADFIETEWRVGGAGSKTVEVLFPSWGSARISAVTQAGERRPVTRGIQLSDIAWFHVESERTGYVVAIRTGASGASASAVRPGAQSSAPRPGPTLTIKVKATTITARLAPARTAEEARAVATRLLR